jgi:hypothetical protein
VEAPQAVVNPHSGPRMLSRSPTVSPLAPPLSPKGRPTCLPRHWAHVRGGGRPQQAPAVVSHVQKDEPRPTEEEFKLETPTAKNGAGDV